MRAGIPAAGMPPRLSIAATRVEGARVRPGSAHPEQRSTMTLVPDPSEEKMNDVVQGGAVRSYARRSRIDLQTPAEQAIRDAVDAVERAGCDRLLTEAVVLLQQARDKVADYVDARLPALRAQIETAWEERADASLVDRLAVEHPEHAEDLFAFADAIMDDDSDLPNGHD